MSNKDKSNISFEESMKELEEIVEILASEKLNLDKMVELYSKAMKLKKECEEKINNAKLKINEVFSKYNDDNN